MKNLLATVAMFAATAAGAQSVTVNGIDYSTQPSANSAPGHSVYVCTPTHVAEKSCLAVDQEYFDSQALLQFGPWNLMVLTGTSDVTGEERQVLVLQGGISTGIAMKLEAALAEYPNIDTLVLSSPGGNPDEARAIYQVVKAAELTTWVPEGKSCMSACAEIFLAGKERIITGVVGFHSAWYNWTLEMPTDLDELVDFIALAAQKHQAVFSAQHQAAGLSGEFNMDIAEAAGEFLVFTSSEELEAYSDPNCFDCVDHTQFLRTVDEAQALPNGDTHKVESVTITGQKILTGAGM
jgi:hypothetical protein